MEWHRPEALYLILPLCAAWLALALYGRSRRRRAAEAFVASAMQLRILPQEDGTRFWLKTAQWEMAIIFSMVALAGPRYGSYYETVRPRGSDLYVLIDVSRSMLAEDVPPSRLGRAKADVSALLNQLRGERVGLIAFAGKAVVKCPLTNDYNFFRLSLNELDPNSAPRGGTAIGDAIRKALEVLPAEADREKALLLITDGDDQESYPMEAAAAAAERQVTIFTVGLGDPEQGARIPSGKEGAKTFIEYKGQQVWSKLESPLLRDIALKTEGVYIPAGTKAYDLGELYSDHLKNRRAGDGKEQRRVRLSEQYQIFLALAVLCLLAELLIRPYPIPAQSPEAAPAAKSPRAVAAALVVAVLVSADAFAGQPRAEVNEGLKLYADSKFDEARDKFQQADEKLKEGQSPESAIVAFDLACALHRKGDTEKARDNYMRASASRDKRIAGESRFNLGVLTSEAARALAGERPEEVPQEKRQEIIDKLMEAVGFFRQCLELQPEHSGARKNIELIRQWIKYHVDRWHQLDREKVRKESNLAQFLEYLIKLQSGIRESVRGLTPKTSLDIFAEHKRAQDELAEEIGPLKEKIKADILAHQPPKPQAQPGAAPEVDPKLEEGIKMLQGWAEDAGKKMNSASDKLSARQPAPAMDEQKGALAELEKIWQAVAPFQLLLKRDLEEQTDIVGVLKPDSGESDEEEKKDEKFQGDPLKKLLTESEKQKNPEPEQKSTENKAHALTLKEDQFAELVESQEETLRWTHLLKMKAEMELKQYEEQQAQQPQQPAPAPQPADPNNPGAAAPKQPTPEEIKNGYKKAIELAPKAAEKMDLSVKSLRQKKVDAAYPDAEEARKILEEIAKAQPKSENQQQDKNQDKSGDKNEDKDKKDQEKKDEEKKDEKKDGDKDKEKEKDKEKDKEQKGEKAEKKQLSKEQIEDLLRKVREREKQKHDRDKEMKGRLLGPAPVEKDW